MSTLLLLLHLLVVGSSYWLSENRLKWEHASTYCQTRCNSNLASLHSDHDVNEAIETIANGDTINIEIFKDQQGTTQLKSFTWIGLNRTTTDEQWQWSDGTSFNYGTNTSERAGVYPWYEGEPSNDANEYCVHMYHNASNYLWNDRICDDPLRFLCASCEGVLDKYILFTIYKNYADSLTFCEEELNTSLASVHNEDDRTSTGIFASVQLLSLNAWIGLDHIGDGSNWHWADGTEFDFGTNVSGGVSPWAPSDKPNGGESEECVQVRPTQKWDDTKCDQDTIHYICNKPNELCYADHWEVEGDISFDGCSGSMTNDAIAVISTKRWSDTNWPLVIEYTFGIYDVYNDNEIGIILLQNESVLHHLFIGVTIVNGNMIMTDRHKEIDLSTTVELNRLYRLRVQLNEDAANQLILVNAFIDDTTEGTFNLTKTNDYRYLGITSINANITAKSLFISGTPLYAFNETLYVLSTEPSEEPSTDPTSAPLETTTFDTTKTSTDPTSAPLETTTFDTTEASNTIDDVDTAITLSVDMTSSITTTEMTEASDTTEISVSSTITRSHDTSIALTATEREGANHSDYSLFIALCIIGVSMCLVIAISIAMYRMIQFIKNQQKEMNIGMELSNSVIRIPPPPPQYNIPSTIPNKSMHHIEFEAQKGKQQNSFELEICHNTVISNDGQHDDGLAEGEFIVKGDDSDDEERITKGETLNHTNKGTSHHTNRGISRRELEVDVIDVDSVGYTEEGS